jgi:hypothetical protein
VFFSFLVCHWPHLGEIRGVSRRLAGYLGDQHYTLTESLSRLPTTGVCHRWQHLGEIRGVSRRLAGYLGDQHYTLTESLSRLPTTGVCHRWQHLGEIRGVSRRLAGYLGDQHYTLTESLSRLPTTGEDINLISRPDYTLRRKPTTSPSAGSAQAQTLL